METMEWQEFVDAARSCGWTVYVGTADDDGRPHVAVVAPGFDDGAVWFATRPSSKKYRNLEQRPAVAFHWPVGVDDAPGEVAAWGDATLHADAESRERIWHSGVLPYDLAAFFGQPDNPDLAFVEVRVTRARLLTAAFTSRVWTP